MYLFSLNDLVGTERKKIKTEELQSAEDEENSKAPEVEENADASGEEDLNEEDAEVPSLPLGVTGNVCSVFHMFVTTKFNKMQVLNCFLRVTQLFQT